jgi:SAM-dependent methyltransferase
MNDASSSFGEAAKNYASFRPSYPQQVFDFLTAHARGSLRAVDLGAGSGQATQALAKLFEHVTAVERDARLAGEARLPVNAEIEIVAAEAADFETGSIDAVISATAFHWMDQPVICRSVANWLKPGGVFFPFAFDAFQVEGPTSEFYEAEFAKWASFRDCRLVECYDYKSALEESGVFAKVIPYAQNVRHELPSDVAAGVISTFSFVRAYARAYDGDGYHSKLKETIMRFGETLVFTVPIVGALGVKA